MNRSAITKATLPRGRKAPTTLKPNAITKFIFFILQKNGYDLKQLTFRKIKGKRGTFVWKA